MVVVLAVGVHLVAGEIISDDKLAEIARHIAEAEQKTTGEIVCVLAKQADDYKYIPVMWAAILALAVPLVVLLYEFLNAGAVWGGAAPLSVYWVYVAQLCVFFVGFLVVQWRPVRFALVPKYIKHRRAKRFEAEAFRNEKIHVTDKRTGILLFIAMGERYVQVVADHGIYQKLDNDVWQVIVDRLVADIKAGNMADGIVTAVDELGEMLATHFPADGDVNVDELPNHLILLD